MAKQRRVTRGATVRQIAPRRRNVPPDVISTVKEEARLRIVEQPELHLSEVLMRRREDVVIPRLTKLLDAFDMFRQVGNDEQYGLTPGEKQYLLGLLWGKMTELRNTFKYGRRGPRYATVADLLRHAGPGTDDDLTPPEGEQY